AVAIVIAIWASRLFDGRWEIKTRLQTSAYFAGGIALVVVPVVLGLIVAGAGPYLYESWVYYPLAKYPERFSLPFPEFHPVLAEQSVASLGDAIGAVLTRSVPEPAVFEIWVKLVIFLPVLVLPFAAVAIAVHAYRWRVRADQAAALEGRAVLAIALMAGLLLLQSWPRADVAHILFGLQPTFILFGYLLHCAWRGLVLLPGPRALVHAAAMAIALVPIGLMLWNGYRRTDWEYANYVAHLRSERGAGVRTLPVEAQRIDVVTRYIAEHTAPDEPIFVVPWAAGFYFLADRANPTRTDFMLFEDPELYPCLLSRLEQRPPKYVIYGYTWDVDEKRFRDYAAPIDRYIRSRYSVESSVDGYEIWRRIEGGDAAANAWPGACQPRRFRWRDLFGRGLQSPSTTARSVQ
ncbi:MAG TPA: hypothetical protein VF239_07315, partial [Vicinamibacterales bacterium]